MRQSRLFALSILAIAVMAFLGVINLNPEPATSVEAIRQVASPTTTTTAVVLTSLAPSEPVPLKPDLTDLGTTSTTIATTTTTAPPVETKSAEPPPASTAPPSGSKPAATTTTTQAPVSKGGPNGDFEADFASKINSFRSGEGLGKLKRDGSLDSRARKWAERMASKGKLSHSDLGSLLPPWSAAGENVGVGGSVGGVFDALKGSSGHRSNMLGDYTHFGIGVWVDADGMVWTAHVFTR